MRLPPILLNASKASHLIRSGLLQTPLRHNSTLSELHKELECRPFNITYDYLSPTPSHLLNISLPESIPSLCKPEYYRDPLNESILLHLPSSGTPASRLPPLPQGDHLVYFPPPVPPRGLLPDGTDTLHSPAAPTTFNRRLWAGGEVTFNPSYQSRLALNGARAACIERIDSVKRIGTPSNQRLFIYIKRKIGYVHPYHYKNEETSREDAIKRIWLGLDAAIEEKRTLVFLEQKKDQKEEKILRARHEPEYSFSLCPTPSLLFRFSALTFNAHKIHYDICHTQGEEGYKKLLVHGPLALVLLFRILQSQLKKGEMITSLKYKNIAPLYAREVMKVCVRKDEEDERKYRIWIEGPGGGYAVRASATVGNWA